jgi:phosphoribosyl-AMP cyclohydrolase
MDMEFDKLGGLLPAIAQDAETGEVLMLGFMNEEAFRKTLETGRMHYFSRSRGRLWMKGETSGHVQEVKEVLIDCDADTALFKIHQVGGAACHTGYNSCFFRRLEADGRVTQIKRERVFDPRQVYGS